ncbi:MAG: ABC transporter permease, partial [Nannocystaceae bacterium]
MAMAPEDQDGRREGQVRPATVLVKGIDPATGSEVIDIEAHLRRASGPELSVGALKHEVQLRPVLDRPDLPAVLAEVEDPRGPDWFDDAQAEWDAARKGSSGQGEQEWDDDSWLDPPTGSGGEAAGAPDVAPSDAEAAPSLPTMFVGKYLAERLQLRRGDVVRLVDPGASFDTSTPPRFRKFKVEGVFEAGFQEYDERLVYVHIRELQAFRFRDADMVSGVDLRLSDPNDAPRVGAQIRDALRGGYQVLEWQELNRTLFSSIRQQKNVITIVLSLVIFVAGFNVLSALWTMVVRRTPEVAILMSMGGTPAQIARVFQVTGMTIGLAGAVAGIAFGLVLCWLVQIYGYTLDPQVYFIESLPVEVSALQIVLILVLALAICFVATIPPALRAAWQRPVDGLRYE